MVNKAGELNAVLMGGLGLTALSQRLVIERENG